MGKSCPVGAPERMQSDGRLPRRPPRLDTAGQRRGLVRFHRYASVKVLLIVVRLNSSTCY